MAAIDLQKVYKRYGRGTHVVRGIDLHIPDRSFVTLVGPSGCGKSTTLSLIAGLEELTSGDIRFDGEVVNDLAPRERDVAMVFQSYALYPHKSVYDNMAFPLRVGGTRRDEIDCRVREAAKLLGIEHLLERRPRDLSGGQRQRVALGRALVRRPRVFLLDEPLSNLDAALRVQMRAEIKKLHEDLQTTFVYVTHDQAEAMTLSDLVVVFHEGVIQQYAPPREIYEKPANVFVARFLGSPPINLLRACIEDGKLICPSGSEAVPPGLPAGEVLAGARPEDVTVSLGAGGDGLRGRIYVVELLGPEAYVAVRLESGELVTAREDADFAAQPGEAAIVRLDMRRLHLFDPGSERRIS